MNRCSIEESDDVKLGLISVDEVERLLASGEACVLKGRARNVIVCNELPAKLSVLLGIGSDSSIPDEEEKVRELEKLAYGPDLIMDLSIRRPSRPFYEYAVEHFSGPVGTLPHYLAFTRDKGLAPSRLIREMESQARAGIAWFTVHPTPTNQIWESATKTRTMPVSSRGGGLVLYDMITNKRSESVYAQIFDEVLDLARDYGIALSIGSVFRPARVVDALDDTHLREIERQWDFVQRCLDQKVAVILEGIGHIGLDKCEEYATILQKHGTVPFMPLGPIPTDAAAGVDHIAAAIGAVWLMMHSWAAVVNSVTRQEHTGGVPTNENMLEGLQAMRVAVHIANSARFKMSQVDEEIGRQRASDVTCVVYSGLIKECDSPTTSAGCSRCGDLCPLVMDMALRNCESPDN